MVRRPRGVVSGGGGGRQRALPKPVWAQQERFPFLKSNFNIVGMFLTDIPTSDNLTQFRGYITMR